MGYIGLPTATMFSCYGHKVIGVDVNEKVVNNINKGKIIATGTPSEIKKKTNTNNLRDAFFALAGDSDE